MDVSILPNLPNLNHFPKQGTAVFSRHMKVAQAKWVQRRAPARLAWSGLLNTDTEMKVYTISPTDKGDVCCEFHRLLRILEHPVTSKNDLFVPACVFAHGKEVATFSGRFAKSYCTLWCMQIALLLDVLPALVLGNPALIATNLYERYIL